MKKGKYYFNNGLEKQKSRLAQIKLTPEELEYLANYKAVTLTITTDYSALKEGKPLEKVNILYGRTISDYNEKIIERIRRNQNSNYVDLLFAELNNLIYEYTQAYVVPNTAIMSTKTFNFIVEYHGNHFNCTNNNNDYDSIFGLKIMIDEKVTGIKVGYII